MASMHAVAEKMHGNEYYENYYPYPVLSNPFHISTSSCHFKKSRITDLMKIILFSYCFQIFTVLSKAELLTTDKELMAIAAAAMIGLSKPKAAIGIAAVL
jgi:hypothetical protein